MKKTINCLPACLLAASVIFLLGPVSARAQTGPTVTQDLTNEVALVGGSINFTVGVSGTAPFNYRWYFDGAALSGQMSSNLALSGIASTNAGSYKVIITNFYGAATSSVATLTVAYPPTFTAQPQNQPVLAGNGVTLSVSVSGTGPFVYQWQAGGTNLANGIITTVAGTGNSGSNGDGGLATNATLSNPNGVALDSYGNMFIADTGNNRIREVGTDGIITTVAGKGGSSSFSGDGAAATNAGLALPGSVALDAAGNLFIADSGNNRIRKVGPDGIISTVAGDASYGFTGDGHSATNSTLDAPAGVAFDGDDDLLIADTSNERVRVVTYGIIITVAGGGSSSPGDGGAAVNAQLSAPAGVAVDDSDNLFIAEAANNRVRKVDENGVITTVAGNGSSGYTGDGISATNTRLSQPRAVGLDPWGNLFIADEVNNRIRKVATNGIITTVAGGGSQNPGDGGAATNVVLSSPYGVTVDAYGNLFIADSSHDRIRKVVIQGPTIFLTSSNLNVTSNYDVVVTGPYGSVTSSVATITPVYGPGILAPPQSQVVLSGGSVTFSVTASGTGPFSYQWYFDGAPLAGKTTNSLVLSNVTSNNAGNYQVVIANPYASATSSIAALAVVLPTLQSPGPTVVAGSTATLGVTIFGSGPLNYQWQCNGTNLPASIITTVAGNGTAAFSGDGLLATNASLHGPSGIAADAFGNLFIADAVNNRIRQVATNGIITTVAGGGLQNPGDGGAATNAGLNNPAGVMVDASGNFFISDAGHYRVRKVGTNGILNTVAGTANYTYSGDGLLATNADIDEPWSTALDASGNLFIADSADNRIRKVRTDGIITTVAGNAFYGYTGDGGPATSTSLQNPRGVAADAYGDFFIADSFNNRIRKVGANGLITTVAGDASYGYSGDGGAATNTTLDQPSGVAVDAYGDLFIADTVNNRIREVQANGIISTVAGKSSSGYSGDGGAATNASLTQPYGVTLDAAGDIFIADTSNHRIRKIVFQGPNLVLTNVAPGNGGTYDVVVTSTHGTVTSSATTFAVLLPPQNFAASFNPGQGLQFQFTGSPTNAYVLLATTNLAQPISWQPVVTNFTDTNGNWTFIATNTLTNPARFYRAMLP